MKNAHNFIWQKFIYLYDFLILKDNKLLSYKQEKSGILTPPEMPVKWGFVDNFVGIFFKYRKRVFLLSNAVISNEVKRRRNVVRNPLRICNLLNRNTTSWKWTSPSGDKGLSLLSPHPRKQHRQGHVNNACYNCHRNIMTIAFFRCYDILPDEEHKNSEDRKRYDASFKSHSLDLNTSLQKN